MIHESATDAYLSLGESQRRRLQAELDGISMEQLWKRPAPGKWSAGEHLDHTVRLNAFFRRVFYVTWVIAWPLARLRRDRPYETEIDDVYEREDMPLNVGWMWPPRHNASRPVGLDALFDRMAAEHDRIATFYTSRDQRLLGHVPLYDPLIGWLNLVQALRVGVYHDEHHYRIVRRILGIVD